MSAMTRLCGAASAIFLALHGAAEAKSAPEFGMKLDAAIAEASASAGMPRVWIEQIIRAESGGDPAAISPAGAMGLMQLMPPTWRELRGRLGLGYDPFDVRDNVLAGAHYLRQMLDRFGPAGGLAAYNAGPARYAEHLAGRSLPVETRAYVARLAPLLLGDASRVARAGRPAPRPWTHSPLFPASETSSSSGPEE